MISPNAAHAVSVLVGLGWERVHACGCVANLEFESGLNPAARGDFSHRVATAFGLAQDHMDRVQSILHGCGVDMRTAGLDAQLRGIDWEIRHTQAAAMEEVSKATTAFQSGYNFCEFFERPADLHRQATMRGNAADQLFRSLA